MGVVLNEEANKLFLSFESASHPSLYLSSPCILSMYMCLIRRAKMAERTWLLNMVQSITYATPI